MKFFTCLVIFLASVDIACGNSVMVYGADPRGGLWGAQVNISRTHSFRTALTSHRLAILEQGVESATYEQGTQSFLLRSSQGGSSSLYFGALCPRGQPPAPRFLADLGTVPLRDEQLGDCVNCQASAFALHRGKLYFIFYGEFFSSQSVSRLVQIRVFEGCGECAESGASGFPFQDMVECSSVVSEVIREQFGFSEYDDTEVKGGRSMEVVAHGDRLTFFFLLANITRLDQGHDKVSLTLWHADDTGRNRQLHTVELPSELSAWNTRAQGSLDYHNHRICWSTGKAILCADFSDHRLRNQGELLTSQEAATSGVCQESSAENIVVSGVSILGSAGTHYVFFGCHPEDPERAGLGVVYFSSGQKHIQALRTAEGPLLAGSLFLEKDPSRDCPLSLDLEVCLDQGTPSDRPDDHKGHFHLDLTDQLEAVEAPSSGQPGHDSTEGAPGGGGGGDLLNSESKAETEVHADRDMTGKDNQDNGEEDDDVTYDDTLYEGNEMPLEDYKYLYKSQELVLQVEDAGIGGVATWRLARSLFIGALLAAILL